MAAAVFVVTFALCCSSEIGGAPHSFLNTARRHPSILATPHLYISLPNPDIKISKDVVFKSDLLTVEGLEEYKKVYDSFDIAARSELCDLQFNATSIFVNAGQSTISVSWNASFVPFAVQGIYYLCILAGKDVQFFDLLDKERQISAFSWSRLQAFIGSLLFSDRARLLRAVVLGTTEYQYELAGDDSNSIVIKSAIERIGVVRRLDEGLVKNRLVASHLVEFLDSRRVAGMDVNAWGSVVTDRIRLRGETGSGQFDIDGVSEERKQALFEASNQVLFFSNLVVLATGLALSFSLLYKLYFGIDSNSYYKGYSGRGVPMDFFSGDQMSGKIGQKYYFDEEF